MFSMAELHRDLSCHPGPHLALEPLVLGRSSTGRGGLQGPGCEGRAGPRGNPRTLTLPSSSSTKTLPGFASLMMPPMATPVLWVEGGSSHTWSPWRADRRQWCDPRSLFPSLLDTYLSSGLCLPAQSSQGGWSLSLLSSPPLSPFLSHLCFSLPLLAQVSFEHVSPALLTGQVPSACTASLHVFVLSGTIS